MDRKRQKESGNALIYVLIAIALFAALTMTLGRQTDTSEASALSDEKAELLATQLINYAAQAKSVADQMIFTGTASAVDDIDFTLPTDAAFNTPPHINKIYHPEGGGLNPASLPAQAVEQNSTDPPAGWYLGRFNNVEWTKTTAEDIILTAHQINKKVCEKINEKVTGSTTIPVLGDGPKFYLIDDSLHTGSNVNLDIGECSGCDPYFSICVTGDGNHYSFYTIIADQ